MADDQTEAEAPESGGKSKLIIIIVVVVLLLGGAGAAAFFLLAPPAAESAEGEEEVVEEIVPKAPARYVKLKPITVNFTVKKKQRFVQISPQLMSREPEMISAMEENMPLIQNSLLMLFSAQDFEELTTQAGRKKLREQALVEVQSVMKDEIGKEAVERVLFTGFIIQ